MGTNSEPMTRPCLKHMACGRISPNVTTMKVVATKPTGPPVKASSRTAMQLLTATLPSSTVQRRRFPSCRTGRILFALRAFFSAVGSPPFAPLISISNWPGSRDMSPRSKPLKVAERNARTRIARILSAIIHHSSGGAASSDMASAARARPGGPEETVGTLWTDKYRRVHGSVAGSENCYSPEAVSSSPVASAPLSDGGL
mmetsp:Transcript_77714/g.204059  ORF Transcript_77714/g.204059 Transcript_77714/m.204059 type:complete len:200 (-) Transcript_77714:14-613(-)